MSWNYPTLLRHKASSTGSAINLPKYFQCSHDAMIKYCSIPPPCSPSTIIAIVHQTTNSSSGGVGGGKVESCVRFLCGLPEQVKFPSTHKCTNIQLWACAFRLAPSLTHRLLSLFAHRNSSEMEIEVDGSEILIPF